MERRSFLKGLIAIAIAPAIKLREVVNERFESYTSRFKWDAKVIATDWRYITRIANINVEE